MLEDIVWIYVVVAYFITSLVTWVLDRWSPSSYQNNMEKYEDDDEKRYFGFKECFWFCFTAITPQGGGETPKPVAGRIASASWWIFGFILVASYTANLAAFLTVSRLQKPILSLDDLAKSRHVKYELLLIQRASF